MMHDSSPENSELEALQAKAEWELSCGRLDEAVEGYVKLLDRARQLGNKYFEGLALFWLRTLDREFPYRRSRVIESG